MSQDDGDLVADPVGGRGVGLVLGQGGQPAGQAGLARLPGCARRGAGAAGGGQLAQQERQFVGAAPSQGREVDAGRDEDGSAARAGGVEQGQCLGGGHRGDAHAA
ncbi:hypothetical protein [Streptomyces sp. NBC_00197]|uniref:hypothetical protein n=1 Tax=Streptomyces sp. NBC_00197 TaxID=2975676 RepID=UPI0032466128